ncbi:MAG: hypothetical protein R3B51_14490 [Thermodesulfobacteriota bacterium]
MAQQDGRRRCAALVCGRSLEQSIKDLGDKIYLQIEVQTEILRHMEKMESITASCSGRGGGRMRTDSSPLSLEELILSFHAGSVRDVDTFSDRQSEQTCASCGIRQRVLNDVADGGICDGCWRK